MYRVFLHFAGCEPEWVDVGYLELADTSNISVFLEILNHYCFFVDDVIFDDNIDWHQEICDFVINLCHYSSLHSIFRYHDDSIEVFHV